MKKKISASINAPSDAFTVSLSDLMAGLLAIFILILSYFILNFSQATSQLVQNDVKRTELLNAVHDELLKNNFEVIIDDKHGILRISEGVLFDVGEASVKPQGQAIINKMGTVLCDLLTTEEFDGSVETIFIEGHTDNTPIETMEFPSNWELSTKRAINTWLTLQASTPASNTLLNKNKQPIFSCSGYADTRPIADNATVAGKSANRRIDFRFTMTPPSEDDMKFVKFVKKRLKE